MTAPVPDVAGWLTRLEETHKAATPGPWRIQPNFASGWSLEIADADGLTVRRPSGLLEADAAAIVAEHNSFGELIAAVRGVLALHEPIDDGGINSGHCAEDGFSWPCPTVAAVARALGAEVAGR